MVIIQCAQVRTITMNDPVQRRVAIVFCGSLSFVVTLQ